MAGRACINYSYSMESLDNIKAMLVFAQVAQYGSFAEAARRLGLTRAVVSYHVKRLESQLNTQLLHRNTRSLSLTPAGEIFYKRCQLISDEAQAATDEIASLSSNPVGRVRLTCSVNWGQKRIVPAIIAFRQAYPRVEVELMLTDEVVNLVEEGIDLAIRGAPLKDSELISRKLISEATVLVAAPSFIKSHGTVDNIEQLAQLDWVIYTPASATLVLSKDGGHHRIRLKGPVKTNNSAARLAFVVAGQGAAKLSYWMVAEHIKQNELTQLLPDYHCQDIDIYGVYPKRLNGANQISLLVDFIKDFLNSPENLPS